MEYVTALSVGQKELYHYVPINVSNPCEDLKRLSRIVLDKQLYLSSPDDFNDPWDCKPWWNTDFINDPIEVERHIEWFNMVSRKCDPNFSEKKVQEISNCFRSNPKLLLKDIVEHSKKQVEVINDEYRVYCLSLKPDNELMWAHYSSKHQGICLEFNARNELFGHALKVSYVKEYPLLDLAGNDDDLVPYITKSEAWKYELEYRLFAIEKQFARSEEVTIASNNYIGLPDRDLMAIILGCNTPKSIENDIQNIINKCSYPIKLKRASIQKNEYKLSIDLI